MKIRLSHYLTGLVFITVVPVVLFTGGLAVYLADQRIKVLETNVLSTTRALVTAVDQNISSMVSSLRILSESESFEADTIQYLHMRLRQFVKEQPDWHHISFVSTSGTQIFNTSSPFGKKLPRLLADPAFKKMLETGEAVISGHRPGEELITVNVPVKKGVQIVCALVGSLKLSSFDRLLKTQNLPGRWSAALLDKNLTYLAHSRKGDRLRGRHASEKITEKSKVRGDYSFIYEDKDFEGYGALANSKMGNWKIFLRIPDDDHLFTSTKTIWLIIFGGGLLAGLSIFVAITLARKISGPLHSLSLSAEAIGEGRKINDIKTNIEEVKQLNLALKTAAALRDETDKKMQASVRMRDQFLSVASHELKSPITTLKLQIQMVKRLSYAHDPEKPMKRLEGQIGRLNHLVDELLDATRISAGKLNFDPELFDLVPLMEEILAGLEEGHLICFDGPEKLIGHWDRGRIEQVIVNLVSNAIKYGNGRPVRVMLQEKEDHVVLEIRDQGVGMTEEQMTKIFQRYERVGNHTGISGLGLGLWIVKKILEGMNGSITVESKIGVGSVFRVTIPVVPGIYGVDMTEDVSHVSSQSHFHA